MGSSLDGTTLKDDKKMKIKSLGSNKTEIKLKDLLILISYETPVAAIRLSLKSIVDPGRHLVKSAAVKTDEYFSNTTSRHINHWLESNGFNPSKVPTVYQIYFDNLIEDNI